MDPALGWSLPKRLAFRFACAVLALFVIRALVLQLAILGIPGPMQAYENVTLVLSLTAAALLDIHRPLVIGFTASSSDRLRDWLLLLWFFAIAALVTLVWSILDRRRRAYPRGARLLETVARWTLASQMLNYGLDKVLPVQMSTPGPAQLAERLGHMTPIDLLWSFMGASPTYEIFAGLTETLAGVLLVFRRTRLLGALVAAGTLTNVIMLNLSYDVCVKMYSGELLLIAVLLIVPHAPRLAGFFLRGEPLATPGGPAWWRRLRLPLGVAAVAGFCACLLVHGWHRYVGPNGTGGTHSAAYGIYDVDEMVRDGQVVPLLVTDRAIWAKIAVDNDSLIPFNADSYRDQDTLMIDGPPAGPWKVTGAPGSTFAGGAFTMTRSADGRLVLDGADARGHTLRVTAHTTRPENTILLTRGFHLVNEKFFTSGSEPDPE